jgi:hypothetical protein
LKAKKILLKKLIKINNTIHLIKAYLNKKNNKINRRNNLKKKRRILIKVRSI